MKLARLDPERLTPAQAAAVLAAASRPAPCLRVASRTTIDAPTCLLIKGGKKSTKQTSVVDNSTKLTNTDNRTVTESGAIVLGEGASFTVQQIPGGARDGAGDSLRGVLDQLAQRAETGRSALGQLPPLAWAGIAAGALVLVVVLVRGRR